MLIDLKHKLASKEDLHSVLEKRGYQNYEDLEGKEYYVEGLDKVFITEKITKISYINNILEIKKRHQQKRL